MERRGVSSQAGDYVRSVRELDPDPQEAAQIAAMLGIVRGARRTAASARRLVPPPRPVIDTPPRTPPDGESETEPAAFAPFLLDPISSARAKSSPPWLSTATPFPIESTRYRAPKLPLEPILAANKVRAILSTLVSMWVGEGGVDLPRMISVMARGEQFTQLHRLRTLTVRRGVQLLIDTAPSMSLFRRDALWLRRELQKVLSESKVGVRVFARCPIFGAGRPADDAWKPFRPPSAGTPILLITDLGIGAERDEKATPKEWNAFIDLTSAAGCPLLALNPYAPHRWPPDLARRITIIPWHRALSVQAARKAARRVRGR
jgi:hypothetical protein